MQHRLLCLLFLLVFLLQGCAYGIYDDKRLLDTMTQDKTLATSIKAALVKKNFTGGLSISVYSYYKHVYLIGEIPPELQPVAVRIAESKNPVSVTAHWFTKSEAADSNFILASRLRAALIGAKGLSSTRIDTEVNAGRVVLLGVVGSEAERKIALRTARHVDGVVNITSYLLLPPSSDQNNDIPEREDLAGKSAPKKTYEDYSSGEPPAMEKPSTTFEERNI